MATLAEEAFIYEPFGRGYVTRHHPCQGSGDPKNGEQWIVKDIIRKSDNVTQETEVYFRDRTAVWSQGTAHRNAKRLSKCIVTDTPILQVNTATFPTKEEEETDGTCLCILENSCLTISTVQGSVFTNALPFKIKRMWPTFNGLCVERRLGDSETSQRSMPTLFTLCHPLEDLKPVIFHMPDTKRCLFVTDMAQHIVHSQVDPPLLVTYDTTIGVHSIWHPRKATEQDQPVPLDVSGTLPEFASVSFAHTSHVIMNDQSRLSLSPLNVRHLLSPMASRHMPSPIRPIPYHSPLLSNTANLPSMVSSFCQSPTVGIVNRHTSPLSEIAHESPRAEMRPLSNTALKGRMSSPFMRMSLSDSIVEDLMFEPLPPDVCLDFVYQEDPDPIRHGSKGMADRVFLTRDFLQHYYLGILVKYLNRLRLFKTDYHCTQFTYREDLVLKDASALSDRRYFVGITLENEVLLFSGSIRVCQLDIASSVERCGTPHFAAQKACWDSLKTMPSPVSGLTEQISALSTSSEIYDSVFRDGSFVSALQDGTRSHVTAVLSNGVMVRSKIPALATNAVVRHCLDVIVQDLEEDLALGILSKFYVALNSKQVPSVACGSPFRKMADMLLQLMGFPEFSRRVLQGALTNSPSPPERKKPKKSESLSGSEEWEQLLESEESIFLLNLSQNRSNQRGRKPRKTSVSELSLTISCPLYDHTPRIFRRLSYLYEELKLNTECMFDWRQLGAVLHFLAMCLGLDEFRQYYEDDAAEQNMLPKHCYRIYRDQLSHLMTKSDAALMFCLENSLLKLMKHGKKVTLPEGVLNQKLTSIVQVFESLVAMVTEISDAEDQEPYQDSQIRSLSAARKLISCLLDAGFNADAIRRLPFGFAIPVREVLQHMGFNRGLSIDAREATLLGREDIALLHRKKRRPPEEIAEVQKSHGVDDGMQFDDQVLRTIFNQDLRVEEVRSLLQSSHPVIINLAQKPEVSDYEFVREQEACLMMISKRTMALPVGRGMFTLGTAQPSMSETLTIPVLEMTGKAVQSNKTVSLAQMDLPGDLLHWPSFHNGVAAGLKVASGSSRVNSTWIVYNKLKYAELTEEHAGFLMALGLMGHLAVLPIHQLHDYLIRGHDLTSVALLLGMAATRVGTRDSVLYKVLSLHIESLLPPTALELGIPHAAHVAAIVAVGMLFSESGDSHLVRVMLREISRPPGPEMENAVDRESHALAAGIALGMIMLGRGAETSPDDLDVGYELYHYIVGGERRHTHIDAKEKYRVASHLVKEENLINTDVTAPSAILALGLMYLKTNNRDVANWLKPSDTITLLETIKPDHLLLKVMARGLIMWDSVNPSTEWINAHLEEVFKKPEIASIDAINRVQELSNNLDADTISQCHSCIIAGCCMSLGFKFAGSFNQDAFNTLLFCTKHFLRQLTSPLFEKRGQSVVEMCLVSSLLSLAMVVAGSGNLEALRIARRLHKRCTPDVTYGSHLAVHMAIGLLFLGGGRYTLKTDNVSVAVLLCAVYPKFPHTSRDNRYHLQALRHLYVLSCEPRLLIPRDIDSKQICYAPVEVTLKANLSYPECSIKLLAPCFLPELHFIKEISITGPRYWPLTISLQDTTLTRDEIFRIIACFNVTKKAGHLPYKDDPKGYKNLMARTFAGQKNQIEAIQSFTADPRILSFTELVCKDGDGLVKDSKTEAYARALFECVTREKPQALNTYLAVEQVLDRLERGTASSRDIGQLALLLTFYDRVHPRLMLANLVGKPLIDEEFVALVRLRLRKLHRQTSSRDKL